MLRPQKGKSKVSFNVTLLNFSNITVQINPYQAYIAATPWFSVDNYGFFIIYIHYTFQHNLQIRNLEV